MSPEHKLQAQLIRESMKNWNNKLTLNAMDYSSAEYRGDADTGLNQLIGDL